jgi:putative ABC transport system permease protein
MIRVTLRGLLARGWRAALTSLAAVVGVAVVAGTLMVSDTADRRGTTEELDVVRQVMLLAGGGRGALLLGVLAALAGLAAGFGVAVALRALINTGPFPGHLPGPGFVLSARTVVAALAVGVLATVLSALAPARRVGRVAPVAASVLRKLQLSSRHELSRWANRHGL